MLQTSFNSIWRFPGDQWLGFGVFTTRIPQAMPLWPKTKNRSVTQCARSLSRVLLFVNLWTVATRLCPWQEYWSELACPPPGDLPNPGTEPPSLTPPALSSGFFTTSTTWEALCNSLKNKLKKKKNTFVEQKDTCSTIIYVKILKAF